MKIFNAKMYQEETMAWYWRIDVKICITVWYLWWKRKELIWVPLWINLQPVDYDSMSPMMPKRFYNWYEAKKVYDELKKLHWF